MMPRLESCNRMTMNPAARPDIEAITPRGNRRSRARSRRTETKIISKFSIGFSNALDFFLLKEEGAISFNFSQFRNKTTGSRVQERKELFSGTYLKTIGKEDF